jgi:hypothetical protein
MPGKQLQTIRSYYEVAKRLHEEINKYLYQSVL